MILIGITGLKGSGKTTVAQMLQGQGFVRLRMAGILKDMLFALGLTIDEIDGPLKEQPCKLLDGKTPRWAMQSLGTEWGRDLISPNLWVNAMKQKVINQAVRGKYIVIDDIRFPNEVQMVQDLNGKMWRIARANVTAENHASENMVEYLPVDVEINNIGTLEELRSLVLKLC